jgi:hypothetical protein
MKSLDVVVLCKLYILQSEGKGNWTYAQLAEQVCQSVGETHASVKRLKVSRLFDEFTRSVIASALLEFLVHGIKYAFPAEIGPPARGIATSHSAPVLYDDVVQSGLDSYVWAFSKGAHKGVSVMPLSKNVPLAVQKDPLLYDFLALIDAIRIGKARERDEAVVKIQKLIKETKEYAKL